MEGGGGASGRAENNVRRRMVAPITHGYPHQCHHNTHHNTKCTRIHISPDTCAPHSHSLTCTPFPLQP